MQRATLWIRALINIAANMAYSTFMFKSFVPTIPDALTLWNDFMTSLYSFKKRRTMCFYRRFIEM